MGTRGMQWPESAVKCGVRAYLEDLTVCQRVRIAVHDAQDDQQPEVRQPRCVVQLLPAHR